LKMPLPKMPRTTDTRKYGEVTEGALLPNL
jgi:hypothetical protein